MPDTLFGQSAQMMGVASEAQAQEKSLDQRKQESTMKAGEAASSEIGADRRQKMSAEEQQKLLQQKAMLDQAENMITITPQLALGLTKNTGEKDWLTAVGQKMRADVYTGLYTHGMALANAKKSPKVTLTYDKNGNVSHTLVWQDEDGNPQQIQLDEGSASKLLNEGKGGGRKGGSRSSEDADKLKKMKEFNRAYEKARSEISDPARAAQLKATNPDSFSSKEQWLKDNQDQYDANIKSLGKGGGAAVPGAEPAAAGGGAQPDNTPFDANAFIKDALGQ
jgi:hypothetical protein